MQKFGHTASNFDYNQSINAFFVKDVLQKTQTKLAAVGPYVAIQTTKERQIIFRDGLPVGSRRGIQSENAQFGKTHFF